MFCTDNKSQLILIDSYDVVYCIWSLWDCGIMGCLLNCVLFLLNLVLVKWIVYDFVFNLMQCNVGTSASVVPCFCIMEKFSMFLDCLLMLFSIFLIFFSVLVYLIWLLVFYALFCNEILCVFWTCIFGYCICDCIAVQMVEFLYINFTCWF